jgi:hypothetical protein
MSKAIGGSIQGVKVDKANMENMMDLALISMVKRGVLLRYGHEKGEAHRCASPGNVVGTFTGNVEAL